MPRTWNYARLFSACANDMWLFLIQLVSFPHLWSTLPCWCSGRVQHAPTHKLLHLRSPSLRLCEPWPGVISWVDDNCSRVLRFVRSSWYSFGALLWRFHRFLTSNWKRPVYLAKKDVIAAIENIACSIVIIVCHKINLLVHSNYAL